MTEGLCQACGICCNGVLFRDVELQAGDEAAQLTALGLPVRRRRAKALFPQPCAALKANGDCGMYASRPCHCRQFECALFKAVASGTVESTAALRVIRTARQRAEEVRRLLQSLGETSECLALSLRFQRVQRRMEKSAPDEESAARFADLSLAVHELNLLLRREFYP